MVKWFLTLKYFDFTWSNFHAFVNIQLNSCHFHLHIIFFPPDISTHFSPLHSKVITPCDIPDATPLFTPLYTVHLSFYRDVTRVHRVTVPESPRRETARCCTRSTSLLLTRRGPALMPRLVAQVEERRSWMFYHKIILCFCVY